MIAFHHIHLRSPDPRKTAAWYVEMLGAKIVQETEALGALNENIDLAGTRLVIGSLFYGQELPRGSVDRHLGLEHFGLQTDEDLEQLLTRLQSKGVEILDPLRRMGSGGGFAFIRAPDDVRIELMQLPK